MKSLIRKTLFITILLIFSTSLGGCLSLSEDITPPPLTSTSPPPTVVEEEPTATTTVGETSASPSPTEPGPSPSPAATVEAVPGNVTVGISNQSDDQSLEGEIQVTLEGYDHMNQVYSKTRPVEEGNEVTFESVPFIPGRLFFASVSYQGAVYRSDITEIEPDARTLDLTVEVFGTTTDKSALSIERLHVFVNFPEENLAQFAEIFIVSNFGQQTVVAEESGGAVLNYFLPPGADNLRFESGSIGERFLVTEEGFSDTASIPPGSGVYQLLVFYDMPYDNQRLVFDQKMSLPVGAVVVMTPSSGVSLKGDGFEDMGVREIQEGSIHVYSGEQLDQGEELSFSLSGIPQGTRGQEGQAQVINRQNLIIGLGIFGGALLVIGVYFYIRLQREERLDISFEDDDVRKEEIMDAIIALDDMFEEGEIAEEAYRQRRSDLKSRLEGLLSAEEGE